MDLLIERYKLAYQEYRAEVSLGTERQKLFVALNPVIAALAGSAARVPVQALALAVAACASVCGLVLVSRSHGRYRQSRHVLLGIARELGAEADWQTTGGMREERGEPRFEGVKVVTAVRALLAVYALFDVAVIVYLLS